MWEAAAQVWETLGARIAPLARWRQAEALLSAAASRGIATISTAWRQADQHQPLMTAISAWAGWPALISKSG